MKVALRNKATGEIKLQKIGWSWTCFLFSPILGIPLFIRKLNVWGTIMLVIWAINFISPSLSGMAIYSFFVMVVIFLIQIGFMIFFGIIANRMAGKNYLEHGWEFAEPTSNSTNMARHAWGLPAN
jgi:hypothetical protein